MKTLLKLSDSHTTYIDSDRFDEVTKYKWFYDHGYARAHIKGKKVYLHRFLTNAPKGMHVDHRSGNKLDNTRSNLRVCEEKDNQRNVPIRSHNTSGYKGVRWSFNKWAAYMTVDKKQIGLGRFEDKLEAARAYNQAALKYFGEFARLNEVAV